MTWNDINIEQFNVLKEIQQEHQDENFYIDAVSYLYDCDASTLPMSEFMTKCHELDFLGKDIPKVKIKNKYILNGHEYEFHFKIDEFTTAQYFDFTNIARQEGDTTVDMLSLLLFPTGHKYLDGYEIEDAKKDIATMSIVDAQAIHFFFLISFKKFIRQVANYLKWQVIRMKKVKMKKKLELLNQITTSMESYLSL